MVVASMPLGPFLALLRKSMERLKSHLIVILVAREADCQWIFAEIERDWASIHDVTGNDIVFLIVNGQNHVPLTSEPYGLKLRDDMGYLRGNDGLIAFSAACSVKNQLFDTDLNSQLTACWNKSPDEALISECMSAKSLDKGWTDNHSLGISSVIATLDGLTERMLPCLYLELVQGAYKFALPLRPDRQENSESVYKGLKGMMIEGHILLLKIAAIREALRRRGLVPRKVAKMAASMKCVNEWSNSNSSQPAEIRNFIAAVLAGEAKPGAVYRSIASLSDLMDGPTFTTLRAH